MRGLVQGVGFRPTVWRIARELKLRGQVINDGEGVLVHLWGEPAQLDTFCIELEAQCPPLARIDSIERTPSTQPIPQDVEFRIAESQATRIHTGIVADAATCAACRAEIFDPADRRYRYPFTNCTHCGPRLSIVRGIPYDRANTSMAPFEQCPDCLSEYQDPADRRFHAQPNACPVCGPKVWLVDAQGQGLSPEQHRTEDAIALTASLLAQGKIVAIKGIGGFHLACDAANADAVQTLRERKRRYDKPFALMAANITDIEPFVELDDAARQLLASPAAPIVLAPRRCDAPTLPTGLAPGQVSLGFMLPYSPLHHILLADWTELKPGTPLVMTSGNRSDEPQCTDNGDAGRRLGEIADYWLLHDREIVNRVDDSVLRIDAGAPRFMRRARGYAPAPLPLPPGFEDSPPLLALGAELKNTFCLLRDGQAIVSQHLGDLEDARTNDAWEASLSLYQELYRHEPQAIVVDLHPDYRSTRFGRELGAERAIGLIEVQHHHAHIASVMADNQWPRNAGPVLGIALDGLGMGDDGTLWGGEFLHADYSGYRRLAHLPPVPLPGGTRALLEPWRNTWSQLHHQFGWAQVVERWDGLELIDWLQQRPVATFEQMLVRGMNSPLSSSCGRLFDAVAGALGIRRESINYEGQAAIELENLAAAAPNETHAYRFTLDRGLFKTDTMWETLLNDLAAGTETARIAARFHNGLAAGICDAAITLAREHSLDTVALSGGVFQNRTLFERAQRTLSSNGLKVLSHRQLPTNDGGISLGQALVAAARLA